MKQPRGVPADRLIRVLERLGYEVSHQKGSHVRLRHAGPPHHSVTVPLHQELKPGTLHSILKAVSLARGMSIGALSRLL
jgi:predicted RNA binding protein YcfA (HicA-like mRNA interferase family)